MTTALYRLLGFLGEKSHWKVAIICCYTALVGYTALRHEIWADEAQAWVLARDANVWDMIWVQARYEGAFPFWHLFLIPLAKLGLPLGALPFFSVGAGVAGMILWLRVKGLPAIFWCLLPFSYWAVYQYSVIARSYCLVLPLLAVLTQVWPDAVERPWRWTMWVIALSLVSLHGAILALSLYLAFIMRCYRDRRNVGFWPRCFPASAAAFSLLLFLYALCMWPPSDGMFAAGFVLDPVVFAGRSLHVFRMFFTEEIVSTTALVGVTAFLLRRSYAAVVFGAGIVGLIGFSAFKYFKVWHLGFGFALWFFAMAIWWRDEAWRRTIFERRLALIAAATFLGLQGYWGVLTSIQEWGATYCGSEAAARYLATRGVGRDQALGFGFISLAVQARFPVRIFANYDTPGGGSFWRPAATNHSDQAFDELDKWPQKFLVLTEGLGGLALIERDRETMLTQLSERGFLLRKTSQGRMLFRGRMLETHNFYVLEKVDRKVSRRP